MLNICYERLVHRRYLVMRIWSGKLHACCLTCFTVTCCSFTYLSPFFLSLSQRKVSWVNQLCFQVVLWMFSPNISVQVNVNFTGPLCCTDGSGMATVKYTAKNELCLTQILCYHGCTLRKWYNLITWRQNWNTFFYWHECTSHLFTIHLFWLRITFSHKWIKERGGLESSVTQLWIPNLNLGCVKKGWMTWISSTDMG